MSSVAEQLNSVLHKTARLIELCNALQEENELLKVENQSIKSTLDASKVKNTDLEEKLRVLKLAKKMGEISIKITISDRIYPLKVNTEEEEIVRRAAKIINERIKDYQENYAVRDKQDLLSMAVLHYATAVLRVENKVQDQDTAVADKVEELDRLRAYISFASAPENNVNPNYNSLKFLTYGTKKLAAVFFYGNWIRIAHDLITRNVFEGRYLLRSLLKKQEIAAQTKVKKILKDAESNAEILKKDRMLEAKEKFLQMKAEHEQEVNNKNNQVNQRENAIKQKEQSLNQRMENLNRKEQELDGQKKNLEKQTDIAVKKQEEVDVLKNQHVKQLEAIAGLSAEEAKNQLVENMKEDARSQAMIQVKDIVDEAKLTAGKEAKKVVIQTIQRTAVEAAIENTVSIFHIESDEIKGRVIGREGRNIRALEAATGIEIIVDDTPEAIILSGFDPVRREIARLALHRLVTDGRIHPARIEEVVAKTKKQIEEEIVEIGERTVIDLGIHGLHPELIRMVGRMRYRSSYGQNLLHHSREVANFCATMAAELGLNAKMAKRAGLLHDIGKVPDDNPELPHAILGMQLAEKYKEHPEICNAIGAHHDEIEMTSMISPIVQACDAISGARPGARREVVESYIKRLKELEELALSYPGVEKTFAIQAGRELRVVVESERVTDQQAELLAADISNRIQTEMTYPGQIKVTVIRETRSVAFAK
eukprot:gene3081-3531_t